MRALLTGQHDEREEGVGDGDEGGEEEEDDGDEDGGREHDEEDDDNDDNEDEEEEEEAVEEVGGETRERASRGCYERCSNSRSPGSSSSNPGRRTGWQVVPNCLKQVA